jgi:alpha-tubulin suppressor-like RCC1 family protein
MGVLAYGVDVISGRRKKAGGLHLPSQIPALEDLPLVSIQAGRRHAVVITAHGSAFAWGINFHGCLMFARVASFMP